MEISNNILAVLVLLAMAISISGTYTMTTLVPTEPSPVTGLQTLYQTGTAQVIVASETAISLEVNLVDFNTLDNTPGTQNDTTDFSPYPFVLKNNGSVVINVSIAEDTGSSLWWNESNGVGVLESDFQFNSTPNGTACGDCLYVSWTDFSEPNVAENSSAANIDMGSSPDCYSNLVANLTSTPTSDLDEIKVHLRITVPENEPAGSKSALIYFQATDAGVCV